MLIDADKLRDCLIEECVSASFNGLPLAIMEAMGVVAVDNAELCRITEQMGIDPARFDASGQ